MKKRINISLTEEQGIALIQFLELVDYKSEIKYLLDQSYNPYNEPEFDEVNLFNAIKKIGYACAKSLPRFFNERYTTAQSVNELIYAVYDGIVDNCGRDEKCNWKKL